MLQRRLNEEHPGAGDGDGGGPAFPAAARGKTAALSSVRPGQLRAGVASKRALLRFVGRRGPLPASLVGTGAAAAGGGGGGGSGGGGAAGEQGGADADGGGAAPAAATFASAPSAGGGSDGIPEPAEGPGDLFQFYRLLLPSLDDERGRYHLKETLLAKALCRAVGRDPATDPGAARVLAWQRDSTGASAGSLAHVARDELVSERFFFGVKFGRERERGGGRTDKKEKEKLESHEKNPLLFSKKKKKNSSISSPTAATSRASPRSRSAGWASSTEASTAP